jgi:hypothetical protein
MAALNHEAREGHEEIERPKICLVIARRAKRAVAIQLDCFVAPRGGTPRNDKLGHYEEIDSIPGEIHP